MRISTVEIVNPRNAAFMVRINEADFAPAIHTLWSDKPSAVQAEAKKATEEVTPKTKAEAKVTTYTFEQLDAMPWRDLKRVYEDELSLGDYPGKDDAIVHILSVEGDSNE